MFYVVVLVISVAALQQTKKCRIILEFNIMFCKQTDIQWWYLVTGSSDLLAQ